MSKCVFIRAIVDIMIMIRVKQRPDSQSQFYELLVQKIIKGHKMYLETISKCFKYQYNIYRTF